MLSGQFLFEDGLALLVGWRPVRRLEKPEDVLERPGRGLGAPASSVSRIIRASRIRSEDDHPLSWSRSPSIRGFRDAHGCSPLREKRHLPNCTCPNVF